MGEDIRTISSGTRTQRGSVRLESLIAQPKKSVSVTKETPWLKDLVERRVRQYGKAELIYDKYGKKPTYNSSIPGYMSEAVKKWAKRKNLDIWFGSNGRGADTINFAPKNKP